MNVGDDGHIELCLDLSEPFEPLFQTGTTERMNRGAVRFIERRLENEGYPKSRRYALKLFCNGQRQITRLQHIHTAKQGKRLVIAHTQLGDLHRPCLALCLRH